jgi:hypothetical protein
MLLRKSTLALLASTLFSQAAYATTEVLYITDGDSRTIQSIQGNVVTNQNLSTPGITHYAISVRDTIWTADYTGGTPGRQEFDTSLTPTANSGPFVMPAGNPEIIDGATDGTYNYTVNDVTGEVYRYNPDWSGAPTTVFTAACIDFCPGITYDPANNSLWTVDVDNIYEYAMDGTLLNSFPHNNLRGALAYESSTGTLWLVDNSSGNTLWQYSKAGALLNTVTTTTSYSSNVWGAEFSYSATPAAAPTPVPSLSEWSMILMSSLLALGAVVTLRRHRQ